MHLYENTIQSVSEICAFFEMGNRETYSLKRYF